MEISGWSAAERGRLMHPAASLMLFGQVVARVERCGCGHDGAYCRVVGVAGEASSNTALSRHWASLDAARFRCDREIIGCHGACAHFGAMRRTCTKCPVAQHGQIAGSPARGRSTADAPAFSCCSLRSPIDGRPSSRNWRTRVACSRRAGCHSPKYRTLCRPFGRTCCRNRRMNSCPGMRLVRHSFARRCL